VNAELTPHCARACYDSVHEDRKACCSQVLNGSIAEKARVSIVSWKSPMLLVIPPA
jgi:hypothetical protein